MHLHMCMCGTCECVCMCVCTCVYLSTCKCKCVHISLCAYMCVHICVLYVYIESPDNLMITVVIKKGEDAKILPLHQTTGPVPSRTRIFSVQPQGKNSLCVEGDLPSMKRVGAGCFRNGRINKQTGARKEEMVYE